MAGGRWSRKGAILATVARLQPVASCTLLFSGQHGGDLGIAPLVLGPADVLAFGLRPGLALELLAAPILRATAASMSGIISLTASNTCLSWHCHADGLIGPGRSISRVPTGGKCPRMVPRRARPPCSGGAFFCGQLAEKVGTNRARSGDKGDRERDVHQCLAAVTLSCGNQRWAGPTGLGPSAHCPAAPMTPRWRRGLFMRPTPAANPDPSSSFERSWPFSSLSRSRPRGACRLPASTGHLRAAGLFSSLRLQSDLFRQRMFPQPEGMRKRMTRERHRIDGDRPA
jgi:hypothetical protein